MIKNILSLVMLVAVCTACAPKNRDLTTDVGTMAEGDRLMKADFYAEARTQYLRIKTEFPQSPLQVDADLKVADAYYNEENFASAATSYDEFMKTYPNRPESVDALYKLGMSYDRQMPSTAQRDTRATHKVVDTFTRLLVDYPNSKYAADAQTRIQKARDQLASKIFEVGRFYEKQGQYDSAARRFAELLNQYPDSLVAEESMARGVRALRRSKQDDKADSLASEFQQKYPNSKFGSYVKK